MSATPKGSKPPTPNSTRRPTSSASTSSGGVKSANTTEASTSSPSRVMTHTQSSGASAGAIGVNRSRSVRNGAPVSARAAAAARKPQAESGSAIEDMKAEMQAKLDELQERLQQAEQACENSQRQAQILQSKLDAAHADQVQLEENVHEQSEKLEELEYQKKESLRAQRELEQIYEADRAQAMKEKEIAQQKEEEMQAALQRMKETLAQRELRGGLEPDHHARPTSSRASSFRSDATSPKRESATQFAPPGSVQRSDSRSGSKLVMQKDKIIEDLRLELAEAHFKLVEADNVGGGRLQQLQKELYEIKMQNARLMEDNDSFQLLLSEKTMNGDVLHSDLLRQPSSSDLRPSSSRQISGASLADELEGHDDSLIDGESATDDVSRDRQAKALRFEVSSLKDQNKALTLYINNIISRLLQHDQFETILDKTPDIISGATSAPAERAGQNSANIETDLPPPPPPKDKPATILAADGQPGEQPQGFLGRAKSVLGRGARRPQSQMVGPNDQERLVQQSKTDESRLTENPDTAPRVPLGRTNSTRGGHRRANSEISGGASLATGMYRGPSPSSQGLMSPGLTSPTGNRGFFSAQPMAVRVPSGSSIPTINAKENTEPQRDSKMLVHASHRSSVISTPAIGEPNTGEINSGATSPPRSTTSSADKDKASGAIMMGSKPRPLRLVQEAAEEEKERKAANRTSWFGNVGGWMAANSTSAALKKMTGGGAEGNGAQ